MATKQKNKPCYVWVVAGISGGHLIPALTAAFEKIEGDTSAHIILFTTDTKLDKEIAGRFPNVYLHKMFTGMRTEVSLLYKLISLMYAFLCGLWYAFFYRPTHVISTGGIVSIPIVLVGYLARACIELYELNALPGRAVRFLVPWTTQMKCVFARACKNIAAYRTRYAPKISHVSYPIRYNQTDCTASSVEIIDAINADGGEHAFYPHKTTLLVLGGSQGSHAINDLMKSWIERHPIYWSSIQVIHQTGASCSQFWKEFYHSRSIPARTFSFRFDIKGYYLLADAVISRAGAGALFELAFFKKRSFLVPLHTDTTDHQVVNARDMRKNYPDVFTVPSSLDADEVRNACALFLESILKKT